MEDVIARDMMLILEHGEEENFDLARALGRRQIHEVAMDGNVHRLSALIASGEDVNARDENSIPVIHCAITGGNLQCVKLLVEAGCDINARDFFTATPLISCVTRDRLNILEYLLTQNPDLDAQDQFAGNTALMWAAKKGLRKFVEVLLQKQCRKDLTNNAGQTAADLASDPHILQMLAP